jgi:hypothetical protein
MMFDTKIREWLPFVGNGNPFATELMIVLDARDEGT